MKKAIFGSVVTLALLAGSILPASASYNDPLPNSSCVDGLLKIYMNPQGVEGKTAVRIDDQANGWDPQNMKPGDILMNQVKGSAFVRQMERGHSYVWWIHKVDEKGVYGPAKAGFVYCGVSKPEGLRANVRGRTVTLEWNAVSGAGKYAIRINNEANGWDPQNMKPGDKLDNDVRGTSYTFASQEGRTLTWWIHAIDTNGRYSDAAVSQVFVD